MSWFKSDEVWNSANLDFLSDVYAVVAVVVAYAGTRSFRPIAVRPD